MSTVVTTQAEMDAAIASGASDIIIDSPAGVCLHVRDSSRVVARGSSSVVAWDSSRVVAWGSSRVMAWDSSSVEAGSHVAVMLHSGAAKIAGGVIIDHTVVRDFDAAQWCAYHGVKVVDGIATVYKAVDYKWTTSRGTSYAPGSLPEAADWRGDRECGGGLHFSPTPSEARECHLDATRFVAVGVRLDEMQPIPGGTAKCKARRVVVACREVTIDRTEVAS